MFRTLVKAFKAVDAFLTRCEEYTEQRVWNGKFIIDLRILSATSFDNMSESLKKQHTRFVSSPLYVAIRDFLHKIADLFMQFEVVSDTVHVIGDAINLCSKSFAHYLIALITGLFLSLMLLDLFKHAPAHFVTWLLPLLFINHLVLSGFFILVEKKSQEAHVSLAEMFGQLKQTLNSTLFLFFLQNSLVYIAGVFFTGFAFMISTLFSLISIEWQSSFIYWLPMIMLALVLIVFVYLCELVLSFAYIFVLHDKKTAFLALQQSYNAIHMQPRYSFFFYLLLTVLTGGLIIFLSKTTFEGGFVVGILFATHAFLLLGQILRKQYFQKELPDKPAFIERVRRFAKPLIAIGIFSYISAAALFIQVQPQIIQYIELMRPRLATSQEYITFPQKRYSIDYPAKWAVYRWNDSEVTFSTNDTGTIVGSVKVHVDSKPITDSDYLMLYEANPGLINYDTGTKNVTTKIANTVINEHNAVKYTYTKLDTAQTEFQIHYLLRHENAVYDIVLITYSKKREAEYMELFETMVNSFTILQP